MIVLYNPPSSRQRKPVMPLSLLAIASLLEGRHEYRIVDGNLETEALATLREILRQPGADFLAVTVMPGPQLVDASSVCRILKSHFPDLTVVWGGYFPSQHFDVCLTSGFVDYVVRGHGELTFPQLIDGLRRGSPVDGLPGLAFLKPDGRVAGNPLPELPDPNLLPEFPYHQIPMERYVRQTFMGRTLSHHSSYGCPFFCNFCAVVNLARGRWKAESAERTAKATRFLVKTWNLDAVEFFDNNFFVDQSRVAEFSDRISDLGIQWWGEARIDTLLKFSESTWTKMAGSGLRMVFLGAESGSDRVLQRMDKGGTASVEKTLEIARKMREYRIIPEFSFVLGSPPDPEEDVEETLAFIRRVKHTNPASEIVLYLYTPVPLEGDLHQEAQKSGFAWPGSLQEWLEPQWQEFVLRRSNGLPWLERRLRNRVRDFEKVLHAYYPTTTDVRLRGARRRLLRLLSGWRYHLRFYALPWELSLLQRWLAFQRPETSGF